MAELMVDLETMGNRPGCPVIAIGAVYFGPKGLGEEFYEVIDLEDAVREGAVMDASTVLWWMKQSDAARAAFARKGKPLREVLEAFAKFCKPGTKLWGNGAAFDNTILASAYAMCGMDAPWKFWDDRCYRTMKNIAPKVELPKLEGFVAHHALWDAKLQAEHLRSILNRIKGKV